MKKIYLNLIITLLCLFSSIGYGSGGMTHMLLAQEAIMRIPDMQLRNLLQNNLEAYLVGAYYPDSGYAGGNHYGEDSHWDPFIYTFADYIKEKYPQPAVQNPKLVAFLFGCAAHRVSDEIAHWTFYPLMAKQDFEHPLPAEMTVHDYGDVGIDLLINIDKNQWLTHPASWWVPVSDLVEVYHRMGHDEYTANEIRWGNIIIYVAGYGERLISASAYPFLQWRMPWTSKHYYDWPEGGILTDEQKVTDYFMALWTRLNTKQAGAIPSYLNKKPLSVIANNEESVAVNFAKTMLENGYIEAAIINNPDGSIEVQPPMIKSYINFQLSVLNFLNKITGSRS